MEMTEHAGAHLSNVSLLLGVSWVLRDPAGRRQETESQVAISLGPADAEKTVGGRGGLGHHDKRTGSGRVENQAGDGGSGPVPSTATDPAALATFPISIMVKYGFELQDLSGALNQ
jgi:hypothetical protein